MENIIEEVQQVTAAEVGKVEEVFSDLVEKVKEVPAEAKEEIKKLIQELTIEEKLEVRNLENDFLKTTAELQRLQTHAQNLQKNFVQKVETMASAYGLAAKEWIFDTVSLTYKKR